MSKIYNRLILVEICKPYFTCSMIVPVEYPCLIITLGMLLADGYFIANKFHYSRIRTRDACQPYRSWPLDNYNDQYPDE
jgi:hypothetical protein